MFGKVVVLTGGESSEREISLSSGQAVLRALLRKGVDATLIDTKDNLVESLLEIKPSCAFIALHGGYGENGNIQSLLEILNIPYTGSGVLSSSICMNKYFTKKLWQSYGVSTPPFAKVSRLNEAEISKIIQSLKLPLVIKPVSSGSSIATFKVNDIEDAYLAVEQALQHGDVLLEKWINGREYSVAFLDGNILPVVEVITEQGFYDYESKYSSEKTSYHCPNSSLTKEQEMYLSKMSAEIFNYLECKSWARVDVIKDGENNFWFLEVNTLPGLTEKSLLVKMAAAAGIGFDDLVLKILSSTVNNVSLNN